MTGCLHIKNGKYYIILSYYENGKRKRPWIATGLPERGNKRKAEQLLRETLHEYEIKLTKPQSDITFADYIRYWLSIAERKVDEVTFQGYDSLATRHILPYFDENAVKLQAVNLHTLQTYIDEKAAHGLIKTKGGLSPRSLKLHKNILHQTLEEAVKQELLPNNPSHYLVLPQGNRFEAGYYTAEQLQALFEAIADEPLYPLVKITALYGLRRSEVLGLKWDSINWDNGTLTIKHTVSKVTKAVEKDKTKNQSSFRSFPLIPEAEKIFRQMKSEETRNKRDFGKKYQINDYIFKWSDGHTYSPDYVTDKFSKLLKKHNLPHIRFHDLRHSCASLLLNNGFHLKDVQEWMGHADIKMTANVYGHLDVSRKQNMAGKLSGVLNGIG